MFWHMVGTVKTLIFLWFFKTFRYSGVSGSLLGHLGDHVGRYWAQDVAKMGTRWMISAKLAILGAILAPRWVQNFFKKTSGVEEDLQTGKSWARPAAEACPVGG